MRCASTCRQPAIASSSRQNDSDRTLPGSLRLWNRSIEMNPSIFSSLGFSAAAISRYSCRPSSVGHTSKITACISHSPKSFVHGGDTVDFGVERTQPGRHVDKNPRWRVLWEIAGVNRVDGGKLL